VSNDEIRRLRRSRTERKIAGVCGGLGSYFNVDPIWPRLGFAFAALPGGIPGIPLYLICWLIIPEEELGS
jgi:phage shock protein C